MPFKKGDPNNPGFKKGQSANPSGRPKSRLLSILRDKLQEKRGKQLSSAGKPLDYGKRTNEELVVEKLLKLAIDDEHLETLKYIFDRMEGKMKDTVDFSGGDGPPVKFSLILGDKGAS